MRGDPGAGDLSHLLELAGLPAGQVIAADVPQELTTRLLGAARARVTGVDIDVTEAGAAELSPEVTVARIGLAGPAGTRQVTADLGLGLALAAAAGAPVRLADAVMDRLAVPVPGDDLLTPFLDRVPPVARARPGHGLPGWPMATLPAPPPPLRAAQPGLRRRAWTAGTSTPGRARHRTQSRTTRPPPRQTPRSCLPPSRGPPGPPPWSRPSSPTTTAAPPSPSAPRSAPIPSPNRPGSAWRSSGTGGARGGPARTMASPSPATAPGPGTRSRHGSPRTPTRSGSASRSPAPARSRCGTRTCALIPKPTPSRPPERHERGPVRRRPGPAGPPR